LDDTWADDEERDVAKASAEISEESASEDKVVAAFTSAEDDENFETTTEPSFESFDESDDSATETTVAATTTTPFPFVVVDRLSDQEMARLLADDEQSRMVSVVDRSADFRFIQTVAVASVAASLALFLLILLYRCAVWSQPAATKSVDVERPKHLVFVVGGHDSAKKYELP